MRRVSFLFIVPQVRDDKDWFYKIKIRFLQQNCNALQCNIFLDSIIFKKRLEYSTQTISLLLRLHLSHVSPGTGLKRASHILFKT